MLEAMSESGDFEMTVDFMSRGEKAEIQGLIQRIKGVD
jgi:hypothetical protein